VKNYTSLFRRLAAGFATLALLGTAATDARADFAYGYASQTISNLSLTPAAGTITFGNLLTFSQDGSTINGSGSSNSNQLDAIQAYQNAGPGGAAPGQNNFNRTALGNPPASTNNFTRGDSQIATTALGAITSGSVVAESFLNTALAGSPANETGSGGLGAALTFVQSTTGNLAITYNYANDILSFTTAQGKASASYGFGITIRDNTGAIVFSSQTAETNSTFTAPPQGAELIRQGIQTVTANGLIGGQTYSIAFNVTAQSAVNAVPEPGSVVLCCLGGLFPIGYRYLRKRNA